MGNIDNSAYEKSYLGDIVIIRGLIFNQNRTAKNKVIMPGIQEDLVLLFIPMMNMIIFYL